jgi:hypothetical protein
VTVIFVEKIEAFCGTVGVTVDGLDGAVRTPDGLTVIVYFEAYCVHAVNEVEPLGASVSDVCVT